MPANATEWDAHHREKTKDSPAAPAGIVKEWLPMLRPGHTLDLACGTGRHTLFLAAQGHAVAAIDWSGAALDILESRARRAKLQVSREAGIAVSGLSSRGMQLIQANLEETKLSEAFFELILCFNYLQRSLFPLITRASRPGGMLLFETYTYAQQNYSDGPKNPAYLLRIGELRTAFPGLRTLFYRELNAGQGIASLVAQKHHINA